MRNRYLLCLLLSVAMIYFALPKINMWADGLEGIFAIAWVAFALIVAAGNLSALLFAPKKKRPLQGPVKMNKRLRAR
ncbi:hypothetical protein [Bacillus sp. FJAT-50079]|uniref:hypothetical protein n=1 Tax=Bacillus sp. FJAT-50079 TaxID=2833577 RepID=UPI001BC95C00|nr:hypothetical protein [Bacillus sp. FJAT-50079]MBS4208775.1 hypothetical protein [Bacillus sp. FJAT-50079]